VVQINKFMRKDRGLKVSEIIIRVETFMPIIKMEQIHTPKKQI